MEDAPMSQGNVQPEGAIVPSAHDKTRKATLRQKLQNAFEWLDISKQQQQRIVNLVKWFKEPANLLSVAAIVAVIIVPWIDRRLKADDELRDKISALLDATHKIVQMNQRQMGSQIGPEYGMASAERQVELERANAIARSIKHAAYPGVLIALSNELCSSGKIDDAQAYLTEVITRGTGIRFLEERPSFSDLAQAHVVSANCHLANLQTNATSGSDEQNRVDYEMATAIKLLEQDATDRGRGQLAIAYSIWADLDDRMGERERATQLRATAREIVSKFAVVDPSLGPILRSSPNLQSGPQEPLPPPKFNANDVPRSIEGPTYVVNFTATNEDGAIAIIPFPDKNGDYTATSSGVLFMYPHGLLAEVYEITSFSNIPKKGLTRVYFTRVVPTASTTGSRVKIDLVWTIRSTTDQLISGVESQTGRPPRAFVARVSAPPLSTASAATR
jgi:hypothetical protein